ncbi:MULTISPECIES: ankyrin repeat domain-containing protein [unclassified Tolypothrix]|uniref:ankyrin repeat domain-containing protein n=1 Tax=unclassified Tolypothrix TaxID=2649714 RepID=UPI0005EAC16B|nr:MULTISPECIES: ankyrin repeat domain-containing protein [unclassified Tolypothrix]EKF00782.1 ankyrin repeat protein [Tolypothrix sp. PCC 7601]BAY89790.1 ankyrin [Microchaete diplosiphon NIES-3275]
MQIHLYAQQGDIAGVANEISNGVDIDSLEEDFQKTPLMVAVSSSDAGIDMLRFLVEHGANVNAIEPESEHTVLDLAVQSGNIDKVQFILDAGADINYQTENGYDVLIQAMYGRDILHDQNLISILNLLISRGATVNGRSSYGETAIKVAAHLGRFDAVQLLLNAGANPEQLGWTELMHAIVFGNLEQVKLLLEKGAQQDVCDSWQRTPFLLSIQVGELAKTKLLLAMGANRNDVGISGKTPLMYAIENNRHDILQWLIAEGFDIEATDDFENTALMMAAELSATDCVKILLEAGVNPGRIDKYNNTAIKVANHLDIVRMLVIAGENLSDINDNIRRSLTKIDNNKFSLSKLSPEQYFAGKHPRFGKTNPELMDIPFWQAMIYEGCSAYAAKNIFNDTENWQDKGWCYQRFGRTITQLPDGRIIEIAGEHEDYYDPDFCIYNDVVVYQPDGSFQIFGYPQDVFPPTDFHSATLVGDYIYIIGNLGYANAAISDETPVYRLDSHTFKIEKVETTGDKPGWISHHKAYYREPGKIYISGGKLLVIQQEDSEYIDNLNDYFLDLSNFTWSRVIQNN